MDLEVKRWKPGYVDRMKPASLRQAVPPDPHTQATPPGIDPDSAREPAGPPGKLYTLYTANNVLVKFILDEMQRSLY